MAAEIAISIPGALPGALGKSAGGNWRVKHEARATAREYATALWREKNTRSWCSCKRLGCKAYDKMPWGSVEVERQQFYCGKPLDEDNLVGRLGPYLDGAQQWIKTKDGRRPGAGIIVDDSWDVIQSATTLRPVRVKHRSEARTVITIREASSARA